MATVLSDPSTRSRAPTSARRFYVGLALLMTLIVIVGFWRSYYGPLLAGVSAHRWFIHVHAAVFAAWMALLVTQVTLAASGRIGAHRRLGAFGIAYGALVLVIGVAVTFAVPALRVTAGEWSPGEASVLFLIALGDMVLFGAFFGAAIAYRTRPAIHKRLIVLATVALLFAAAARFGGFGFSAPLWHAIWLLPVAVGIGYDALTEHRVHPVYWIGVATLLVAWLRVPFAQTQAWQRFGGRLFESLL